MQLRRGVGSICFLNVYRASFRGRKVGFHFRQQATMIRGMLAKFRVLVIFLDRGKAGLPALISSPDH